MRKLFAATFLICAGFVFGSNWVGITSDTPQGFEKTVLFSNEEATSIRFTLDGFWQSSILIDGEEYAAIAVEGGTPLLEAGAPDVEKLTASIIIPDQSRMTVTVVSSEYTEYNLPQLAPSKGNFTRNISPDDVPWTFGESYHTDAFFPGTLAQLGTPYIARDFRGVAVHVYPFQYNPVTQTLRVYTELTVEVTPVDGEAVNPKIRRQPLEALELNFKQIYEEHFDNWNTSRYDILSEQGNMLVVCYDAFLEEMAPFVEWKNIKGLPTQMVSVSEAGGSAGNIAQYIEDMYYNEGLAFVLLVGDIAQVPSIMTGGSASDPSYGFIEGNDSYAEIMVGRFSAENADHVSTQVERSVNYERYPMSGGDWYHMGIGIASAQGDGIGDDGEADYDHEDNIRDQLLGYTYSSIDQIYDTNGGTDTDVTNSLNEGRSIINYTGHGSSTSWGTTGFNVTDVNNLQNDNLLPFIWSVACVNGEFQSGTCFAEAWLRATHNGEPTGAIATLMSTVNQSWAPPMQGQDEFNAILTEQYGDANIKRCFGGISANGCMSMNDEYGSSGESESDYWTLFGDPSIVLRTATPDPLTVTHDAVMVVGSSEFPVNTGVANALAALSSGGELLGFAYADNSGLANIVLSEPVLTPGELHLVVTGYNVETYEADLFAIVPEGPFVVMDNYVVENDSNGNGDIDYGESVEVGILAENVGVDPAVGVTATISSDDPYITITNDTVTFNDIAAGETELSLDAAAFDISNTTPDGHTAVFNVTFTGEADTWYGGFSVTVNAYCVTGDVNADWEINVLDVIRSVNIILNAGEPPTELELCSADTNQDGIINILDIIGMINFIVGRDISFADHSGSARVLIDDGSILLRSTVPVAGLQLTVNTSDIEVMTPENMQWAVSNNNGQMLLYSLTGNVLPAGETLLFETAGDIEISSVIVVNEAGDEINSSVDLIPETYVLSQNYPNPFNPVTMISFETPRDENVQLVIYDILGRQVKALVQGPMKSGYHTVKWDGLDALGNAVPSGLYIYTLTAGDVSYSKKMMLMK
ncbi:MAG: T9SS type A sorting domain-containing protein [FCB group bacterium]|nr:T9SS type A sorting domain-containing protein [FCB group bacterium]